MARARRAISMLIPHTFDPRIAPTRPGFPTARTDNLRASSPFQQSTNTPSFRRKSQANYSDNYSEVYSRRSEHSRVRNEMFALICEFPVSFLSSLSLSLKRFSHPRHYHFPSPNTLSYPLVPSSDSESSFSSSCTCVRGTAPGNTNR